MSVSLPILDVGPQRPVFAQGPRSLSGVKLLRISVTDRCNLRCAYCMPEGGVEFADKDELLSADDFAAVARMALDLGVTSLKLTGGEPTVRGDIVEIATRLGALGPRDLSMTTNGLQLRRLAAPLRDAGVERLTLSLDSLDAERYRAITGGGRLDLFWDGIDAAQRAGFVRLKINMVVVRGMNDDEVEAMAALSLDRPWTIRFIEYMPLGESRLTRIPGGLHAFDPLPTAASHGGIGLGGARESTGTRITRIPADLHAFDPSPTTASCGGTGLGGARESNGTRLTSPSTEYHDAILDNAVVMDRLAARFGPLEPVARANEVGVGPANVFRLPGAAGRVGFISAMSRPFCETCNRLRLTATGQLRSCLFDGGEIDVLPALRPTIDAAALARAFADCVVLKPDVHGAHGNRAMSQLGG
ncbi:MAG: GTP 3',8-cyclase MoaA [Phycisphaerales bacterium]